VKFLADECVDAAVAARLRSDGHDVLAVAELAPGLTDDAVLELANADGRILVTADADFGELIFRQRRVTSGVLLVRLAGMPSAQKADAVAQVVVEHGSEMAGTFTVLSAGLVRIRPPLQP
jgi:predicted nuclease of predicted toxin-antitoxin system